MLLVGCHSKEQKIKQWWNSVLQQGHATEKLFSLTSNTKLSNIVFHPNVALELDLEQRLEVFCFIKISKNGVFLWTVAIHSIHFMFDF